MESANYLRTELTTRIAHRLRDMQTLPFVAMSNEQLDSIYQYYWSTFETLRRIERIETLEQNEKLIQVVTRMLSERKSKLSLIAGISRECINYMEPETVDLFLARMLRSQVSREVLAKQHIALSVMQGSKDAAKGTKIGMIDTHLSVLSSVHKSIAIARQSIAELHGWDANDSRIPDVKISGDSDIYIAYLPAHLEFILLELCKVSMQSTMAHYTDAEGSMASNPPNVHIILVEGPDRGDISIRVSDQGGGLPSDIPSFARLQAESKATRARGPILLAGMGGPTQDPNSGLVWSFMNIGEQLERMNVQLELTSTTGIDANNIDGAMTPDPTASYPGGDGLMRLSVLSMESKSGLPMYVVRLTQCQTVCGAFWWRPRIPYIGRVGADLTQL